MALSEPHHTAFIRKLYVYTTKVFKFDDPLPTTQSTTSHQQWVSQQQLQWRGGETCKNNFFESVTMSLEVQSALAMQTAMHGIESLDNNAADLACISLTKTTHFNTRLYNNSWTT